MNPTVDDFLSTDLPATFVSLSEESNYPYETLEPIEIVTLGEGEIDPRLKLLSHSSRTTLHKCPRKYQLYRLGSQTIAASEQKEAEQGVTFAFGKAVGVGVQSILEGKTESQVTLDTFLEWDTDLLANTPSQGKSFWTALFAVQKFAALAAGGLLADYDLVYYKGKPAIELSFQIRLPNGFLYRGFVDAVLQHRTTGAIVVLENKTSSGTAISAQYKNSGQALGYSVILDILFPEMSAYEVLYMVYETKSFSYVELPFTKSLLQRALWLQELLIDSQAVELYHSYGTYPMHGEACYDFFRECEYLGLCELDTANFTKPLTTKIVKELAESEDKFDFNLDFYDLVQAQVDKAAL